MSVEHYKQKINGGDARNAAYSNNAVQNAYNAAKKAKEDADKRNAQYEREYEDVKYNKEINDIESGVYKPVNHTDLYNDVMGAQEIVDNDLDNKIKAIEDEISRRNLNKEKNLLKLVMLDAARNRNSAPLMNYMSNRTARDQARAAREANKANKDKEYRIGEASYKSKLSLLSRAIKNSAPGYKSDAIDAYNDVVNEAIAHGYNFDFYEDNKETEKPEINYVNVQDLINDYNAGKITADQVLAKEDLINKSNESEAKAWDNFKAKISVEQGDKKKFDDNAEIVRRIADIDDQITALSRQKKKLPSKLDPAYDKNKSSNAAVDAKINALKSTKRNLEAKKVK